MSSEHRTEQSTRRGRRHVEVIATVRRSLVRVFTRMTTHRSLRAVGDAGMRVLFNRLASNWERIRAGSTCRETTNEALAALPHHAGGRWSIPSRILDIACGTGLATAVAHAAFPAAHVTGLDLAASMIDHARELVPEADFVVGSSRELPFEDNTFDLVMCVDGIFDEDEIARVCAPGGSAMILYSLGAATPISRPVADIVERLRQAGMSCAHHEDDYWCIWAYQPAASSQPG